MKTEELKEAINHLKFVFNGNNYIQEANYIFINQDLNVLRCYSNDIYYSYRPSYEITEEFNLTTTKEIAIDAKMFHALLNKTKVEEIKIKQKDDILIVRVGRSISKFKIYTIPFTYNLPKDNHDYTKFFIEKNDIKNNMLYDKNDNAAQNIFSVNGSLYSTDIFNIVRFDNYETPTLDCGIRWDNLKEIVDKEFNGMKVVDDAILFKNEEYHFICKNETDIPLEIKDTIEYIESEPGTFLMMDKEEDISIIDSFLLDYKKLDKMVKVSIVNNSMMFVTATNKKSSMKLSIPLKCNAEVFPISFTINVDYFKDLFYNYDRFFIGDNVLYCATTGFSRCITINDVE